jgi:hypothetical protein
MARDPEAVEMPSGRWSAHDSSRPHTGDGVRPGIRGASVVVVDSGTSQCRLT